MSAVEGGPAVRSIECPGCGLVRALDRFHRTAGEFCARCDYPLFFAPVPAARPVGDASEVDAALRRLPSDRVRVATEACPACGERNLAGAATCLRCGSDMQVPEPPAPTEPEVVEPAPAPPPTPQPLLSPALVAALIGVLAVVALLVLVVRG